MYKRNYFSFYQPPYPGFHNREGQNPNARPSSLNSGPRKQYNESPEDGSTQQQSQGKGLSVGHERVDAGQPQVPSFFPVRSSSPWQRQTAPSHHPSSHGRAFSLPRSVTARHSPLQSWGQNFKPAQSWGQAFKPFPCPAPFPPHPPVQLPPCHPEKTQDCDLERLRRLEELQNKKTSLIEAIGAVLAVSLTNLAPLYPDNTCVRLLLVSFNAFLAMTSGKASEVLSQEGVLFKARSELSRFNITVNDLAELILEIRRLELQLLGYTISPQSLREQITCRASNFLQTALDKQWLAESFVTGPVPELKTFQVADMWELQSIQYIRSRVGKEPFPNIVYYVTMAYYTPGNLDHVDFVYGFVERELLLFKLVNKWICNLERVHEGVMQTLEKTLDLQKRTTVRILEEAREEVEREIEFILAYRGSEYRR